jgi:hypothetical protein
MTFVHCFGLPSITPVAKQMKVDNCCQVEWLNELANKDFPPLENESGETHPSGIGRGGTIY